MTELTEIRFHSRAGQGAKIASEMFVEALLEKGSYIQAFPEYGAARQGAPMQVFARIYDKPIKTKSNIYNPHIVVVLDETLLSDIDVCSGLRDPKTVIVNTKASKEDILKKISAKDANLFVIDATQIAIDELGIPITNTSILGSLVKASGLITLDEIKNQLIKKFENKFGKEIANKNIKALERGFKEVK